MRMLYTSIRPSSIALLATLSVATVASAQSPSRSSAPETSAVATVAPASIQIDNFARVNDSYYRGAQPVGRDYADLAALGIKTIINLTSGEDVNFDEKESVERNGMRYVHIPMSTRRSPTEKELAAFFAVTNDAVSQPVYVHCVGGRHRTGVMTAVYRMTRDGLSGEQAFKEMKQFKYGPDFLHPEFKKFVYDYRVPKTAAVATAGSQQ
jgi:protein tyrosine/serine phosphatase